MSFSGFSGIFDALTTWPSVDNSEILRSSNEIDQLRQAIEGEPSSYIANLEIALENTGIELVIKNSNGRLTAYGTQNATVIDSQTKAVSEIRSLNGVVSLKEVLTKNSVISKKTTTVNTDNADSDDYQARYLSADFRKYEDDGSNLSFLRIRSVNDPTNIIFPNYTASPAPGITQSKFKQFILTQVSVSSQERLQLVETNSSYQALFFGKKPEILQIGGILKNTLVNDWTANMIFLWDELMRGTKLVENGWICELYIDGELFVGYPFNFSRTKIAGNEHAVQFGCSFLIKDRKLIKTDFTNNPIVMA